MKNDDLMFEKRKEHPALTTEMSQYAYQLGFDDGVKCLIEKACDWLSDYIKTFDFYTESDVETFRKAMEE